MNDNEQTLIAHLEALRRTLLRCAAATAVGFPVGYWLAPHLIGLLVRWSFPAEMGALHYFAPMEVFIVRLKLALIAALVLAYPWNVLQIWRFLLPALYASERRALGWWIIFSSLLFFGGITFCAGLILPMLMSFSASFASPELQPMLGLSGFLSLAGWLMLAFGVMFQSPAVVMLAVRFGFITVAGLRRKRPYIMTGILIIAAVLTPPDVVSQVLMAVPCWLLFELGVFIASRLERRRKLREAAEAEADQPYEL